MHLYIVHYPYIQVGVMSLVLTRSFFVIFTTVNRLNFIIVSCFYSCESWTVLSGN